MSILDAKKFLEHYSDEKNLDCIVLGREATLSREDVLNFTESDKEIKVSFMDCDEEMNESISVKLDDIILLSDVTIWAD